MRLGDVVIGHVCELGQPLELTRSDEIVVLLPSEVLENGLSLRVEVQLLIIPFRVWQNKLEAAEGRRPCVNLLLGILGTCFALLVLPEEGSGRDEVEGICKQSCLYIFVQLRQGLFDVSIGKDFIVVNVK